MITTGPVLGTLAQVIADGTRRHRGLRRRHRRSRDVIRQWQANGNVSWKLPLLERVMAGPFTGKESTPYGAGTVHDFMHAKVTVCDDTVFVGSFNLSRSGEKNAENVLEIEDAAIADRLAAFVDEVRARYPGGHHCCQCTRSSAARRRSLRREPERRGSSPGLPMSASPIGTTSSGSPSTSSKIRFWSGWPMKALARPFVDRGQEHEHHQRARIDEPVRDGPRHLGAARRRELVGFVVASVIERLVRRDHEQDRRVGDVVATAARVVLVAEGARDLGALARHR